MRKMMIALLPWLVVLGLSAQRSTVWDTRTIRWQRLDADGSKYAVLEGDRAKPGLFTYAFYLPDGVWYPPHLHSQTARVFVVSGTLLLGEGSTGNKSAAVAIPAGGCFLVPAGAAHWEGARGDTVIVGVASGPWMTTLLKPAR